MKKIFLAAAIIGISGFAFGQQAATASKNSKDAKCSKACMKTCGDKNCTKSTCTKDGKKASASTATAAASTGKSTATK